MIFSAVAYFIQHWRVLSQVQSGIGVLLLPIMLFVPESPRWLVAKQKYEQADHVIHRIVIGEDHTLNAQSILLIGYCHFSRILM